MSPDEIYQLWCHVGMGGGHELHLHDGHFSALIFADSDQENVLATNQNHQRVGVIADEQLQVDFGPVNVERLYELTRTVGVHVFEHEQHEALNPLTDLDPWWDNHSDNDQFGDD